MIERPCGQTTTNKTVATADLDAHADDMLRLIDRTPITSVTLASHCGHRDYDAAGNPGRGQHGATPPVERPQSRDAGHTDDFSIFPLFSPLRGGDVADDVGKELRGDADGQRVRARGHRLAPERPHPRAPSVFGAPPDDFEEVGLQGAWCTSAAGGTGGVPGWSSRISLSA